MGAGLKTALEIRQDSLGSRSFQFRRPKERIKPKKIQKKFRVRLIHILLTFLFTAGLFLLVQQTYLFLITWDNLNVRSVEVECSKTAVKEEILQLFKGKILGNILLLDIGRLQNELKGHRWVKDVYVRKIFPSSLKIEIKERTPAAVVKKGDYYLVDRDGVLLEKTDRRGWEDLPLFIDSNHFQRHYREKLKLAWKCLDSLPPQERDRIEVMDLSEYANVVVKLRGEEARLKLGSDRFLQKMNLFFRYRPKLEKFKPLEYVDLRFDDRLYLKPQKNPNQDFVANPEKEAR